MILSGAFYPDLKIGVWRRERINPLFFSAHFCYYGAPDPSIMPTIVTARNLVKTYGDFTAVDGISFDIEEGECFGFLGPNGAGKTTTVRMIHCVSPVTAGTLVVNGRPADIDNRALKATMGIIPQEITLDIDLTVRENLMVFSKFFDIPRREAKKRIAEGLTFRRARSEAQQQDRPALDGDEAAPACRPGPAQ